MPDHSFGEGFLFGVGRWRTSGALHHEGEKGQVPFQMFAGCLLQDSIFRGATLPV